MDAILADMFPASRIGYPVIFARFVGAILLGGIIGFEREAKNRPAGLKTHIMVALAAAVFSIISIEAIHTAALASDNFKPDPLRVIEAVTAGVAFLAAGTIVLSRGEIHGITTGASLWLAGAIGLCLGFGHWVIGFAAVVAGISILFLVGKMEDRLDMTGSMPVDDDTPPKGDPPKGE
ncbi:MgtC/SapB family protein [Rhizobium sp. TH2]|uniref:MgtC/SapB family protein n=1 Tax=Rhizobium sp. TH2 TaxID=2775403 RepID=UPI0021583C80|nr:MgtC/SapB family protein [Rhizobium sp. TH2]UVC07755.1 MgtC/SapB family protein [Rhizobium sp. TH2]